MTQLYGYLRKGWPMSWVHKEAIQGELATKSLEFEFHLQFPCGSPLTALSDFCQLARSGNKCECKQTLKKHVPRLMTSLLMSSPLIIISHRLFQCRYSNPWDVVEKLSFLFLPRHQSAPGARYSCYRHLDEGRGIERPTIPLKQEVDIRISPPPS